jgi:PAS domain S-box-containing protein
MVQAKRRKTTVKKSAVKQSSVSAESIKEVHRNVKSSEGDRSLQVLHEVEDYAMMLLDPKGVIRSWNKGAERIKGYKAEEIIGKNYRIFYTSEDRKLNLSENLLTVAKRDGRTTYEGWRVKKDGTRFWASMSLTALHDEVGNVTGYLKITRDLTDKKVAEDAYSNLVEELQMRNEELRGSEERYHKMVSEVQDYAIILLDNQGKILDWNKGAEKLKKYSAKEIIGKSFRLFYTRDDKESKLPERLLKEAERKGSVVHEGWRIRKDGKRFWGNVTITALHNDAGQVIGYSKVTRDLTEKKVADDKLENLVEELRQANEHLKESEERYQKMTAEVQDYAIIVLDTEGNVENWNVGAQVIKGYSSDEILGKSFKLFYPKEDVAAKLPDQLLAEARRKGKVTHEGWRVRKNGSRFWGSVVITALHNSAGEIIGFSKVTRDLTERKMADDNLRASASQIELKNKALERVNEELASFTNIASHDLKEPLRKIQTFADRIKDGRYDAARTQEFLNKIIDGAARMQRLIGDLLSFSEVSNDGMKSEDVDLNQVINRVKADLEIQISETSAIVQFGKLPVIRAIPHQMHQLFLNLVSNAIKYSRPGIIPTVNIHARLIKGPDIPGQLPNGDNQYYHITVKDNGLGFHISESSRIFNPFFRLHPKGRYEGTGLGLAIVKKIVDGHNGIVLAESEPGVGSEFHIYIPRNKKQQEHNPNE